MKDYIKKTIQTYNDFAERYEKNRTVFKMSPFLQTFQDLLPKGRVLDIGCASGRDAKLLVEQGYEVVGIDLSTELLKMARENVPSVQFLEADMLELPFEDNSFDGIWSAAVVHHLKVSDMPTAIKEMYRVLKPGGVVFIGTKSGEGEKYIKEEEFDGAERFFTYIDAETLENMCSDAGFVIKEMISKTSAEVFGDAIKDYARKDQGYHDIFLTK